MRDKVRSKEQLAKRAEEAFKSAEQRDAASKQIVEADREKAAAKTARLRALRLAKEAADPHDR